MIKSYLQATKAFLVNLDSVQQTVIILLIGIFFIRYYCDDLFFFDKSLFYSRIFYMLNYKNKCHW